MLTTRRLFSAVFIVALVVLATRNATDPDLGWHLRTGEYIVTTGTVPQTDFFSFTAAGEQRTTHEWLVDALFYLLFRFGGYAALTVFAALAATAGILILYLRCDGKPYIASFVVLLAALALAPFWGARPQTVTLLFANLFLYLLDRFKGGKIDRSIYLLVPLTLLWANLHGGFMLGLVLILAYAAGMALEGWTRPPKREWRRERHLVRVLLLSVAAVAINPAGFELYLYPFQTLNSSIMQTLIQEWQPPDLTSAAILPYALMLALTIGGLALSGRRMGIVETLLLTGLTLASLRSARQVSLWVLVAAPILSAALADLWAHLQGSHRRAADPDGQEDRESPGIEPRRRVENGAAEPVKPPRAIVLVNCLILVAVSVAAIARVALVIGNQAKAEAEYFPVAAVDAIESRGLRGPILNQYEWGGYLIWRLYPHEQVFIDGRADLYALKSDRVVQEYLATWSALPGWRLALDRYSIRLVLVSSSSPLAAELLHEKHWMRVYQDRQATVFERGK